ncbi:hypothetical protein [Streptomyces cadmiisoli]|uniref:hypothetical protein n=1 Tax=Streptomyces cadmiisoli TaxID=2184053 RepID=UPI003D721991
MATAGTRRHDGARSTEAVARAHSAAQVHGLYTPPGLKRVSTGAVDSFTTASGITGSVATSRSTGIDPRGDCPSAGKATTFAFKNSAGHVVSWLFAGADGVGAEVPDTTVERILGTLRRHAGPSDS